MRFLFLLVLAPVFAQQPAVSPDTVVLTVHGQRYTRAEFEEFAKAYKDTGSALDLLSTANGLARTQTLADEARRRGLGKQPDVQTKIKIYENNLLKLTLFNQVLQEVHADEASVRKYFASKPHVAEERKILRILIRHTKSIPTAGTLTLEQAKAKAEAIHKRLAGGADFAAIAKVESDDEKSKAKGGEAGQFSKPLMLPEVGEAAFKMKVGEISDVIKTTEGYEIIRLEKISPPAFELVRKSLEYEIAAQRLSDMEITDGVHLNPDYFGKGATVK